MRMSDQDQKPEATQTTPTGVEIPIPTREAFLRDLRKVVQPAKPDDEDDRPTQRD